MPKISEAPAVYSDALKAGLNVAIFNATDPANPDASMDVGARVIAALQDASFSAINTPTIPGSGVSMVHKGRDNRHTTILTLTDFALGNSGDNANLALGALLLTLPAGPCVVRACHVAVGVTIDDATQTDTPEIGLGNIVGTGVVADLQSVGIAAEYFFAGQALADVAGTVLTAMDTAVTPLLAADAHTIYLNVAGLWSNFSAAKALTADGTIILEWDFLG